MAPRFWGLVMTVARISSDTYRGCKLVRVVYGVACRWHVENEHGLLPPLGFKSKAALKRWLDRDTALRGKA